MPPGKKATAAAEVEVGVLDARLDALKTLVENGFNRMEDHIKALDTRVRSIEIGSMKDLESLKSRLDAAFLRIDEQKVRLDVLNAEVSKLPDCETLKEFTAKFPQVLNMANLMKWVIGVVGVMIITLIWGIVTHQITVTFNGG